MTAGGNNFNDFAGNQLAKFRAVFHPDGCCKQRAVTIMGGATGGVGGTKYPHFFGMYLAGVQRNLRVNN